MKKDDIWLPPSPEYPDWIPDELAPRLLVFLQDAQIEAIKADRQRRHEGANASEAYDVIDSFLRNNLDDDDYALYSKALDVVYTAPQPTEEVFCEECGDGLVVEDPGICGTCYQTKYVSPQTAEPVKGPSRDDIVMALTSCKHSIESEKVILYCDGKQKGNALSQAVDRVVALLSQYVHAATPEDWQLVPKDLLERVSNLFPECMEDDGSGRAGWMPHTRETVKEFRAMLEAALKFGEDNE